MNREIVLYGALAEKYGRSFLLDVSSAAEAVRALASQLKGFANEMRKGEYQVKIDETYIDENELLLTLGRANALHFIPVPCGSKNDGILKVILGIALIGIGFAVSSGAFAFSGVGGWTAMGNTLFGIGAKTFLALGAGLAMSGLAMMLSPTPTLESNESADDTPSYLFNGAINITEEGNCVPLCYGVFMCGSVVVSCGMTSSDAITL